MNLHIEIGNNLYDLVLYSTGIIVLGRVIIEIIRSEGRKR